MTSDKPILFQGNMVRAILEGRKTQTRRLVTGWNNSLPQGKFTEVFYNENCNAMVAGFHSPMEAFKCPYGTVGGTLWVRENWGIHAGPGVRCCESAKPNAPAPNGGFAPVTYMATTEGQAWGMYGPPKWKPSIHMPRSACRLNLKISEIRCERLQLITAADAIAEGIEKRYYPGQSDPIHPVLCYRDLWDSINGKPMPVIKKNEAGKKVITHYVSYPWQAGDKVESYRGKQHFIFGNPWVWVVGFARIN